MTSTLHRTPLATAGLALVVALGGCGGGGGDSRETPPYVPKATTVDATTPAPAAEPLTIASPMFADGAPIPVQFSCKGGQRGATVDVVVARGRSRTGTRRR